MYLSIVFATKKFTLLLKSDPSLILMDKDGLSVTDDKKQLDRHAEFYLEDNFLRNNDKFVCKEGLCDLKPENTKIEYTAPTEIKVQFSKDECLQYGEKGFIVGPCTDKTHLLMNDSLADLIIKEDKIREAIKLRVVSEAALEKSNVKDVLNNKIKEDKERQERLKDLDLEIGLANERIDKLKGPVLPDEIRAKA